MSETSEQGGNDDVRSAATGRFFSINAPLGSAQPSYVRRRADDLLYEAALGGRYAHVIAPDRSGKSSLIAAIAARLDAQSVRVAILDLSQLGNRDSAADAGRWYYNVAYRLLRQLRIRFELQAWWQDKSILGNRQRLLEFYAEVLLQNITQPIVVFVDEMQCVEELPFADQLLASIRSAHSARATDPEFSRLTFVLLGECDPQLLVNEPDASPFAVTQAIALDDFTRADLEHFACELPIAGQSVQDALDRIYFWTRGQPYLCQKLARAVARDAGAGAGDIAAEVDRIALQQLAGRAALNSEPHMSHLHRQVLATGKAREGLLNLYGRIRKGITVSADLGSPLHRRLLATGLVEVDEAGELRVRNRAYETVFTARWANENIRIRWQAPLLSAAVLLAVLAAPLWYTQWLPRPYARLLADPATTLADAETAWRDLAALPGHAEAADRLYRSYLQNAALQAESSGVMATVAGMAGALPDAGSLPQELTADFWDRRAQAAMRDERRDEALLASLEALAYPTPARRHRAAVLVGDDYPLLRASVPAGDYGAFAYDPASQVLSAFAGPQVTQWSLEGGALLPREHWNISAPEVTPLVRRVIVDRPGQAERVGLSLNLSHPRLHDLRIRLIAPSGRAVEVALDGERASNAEDLRVPPQQLAPLIGESLAGTWTLSLRDEATGVAGHLAGWTLMLNSQGLVESFERGLGIPDPTERDTGEYLLSPDGRYAVARAAQSDSARVWDLVVAKPLASLAVAANETLVGVGAGADLLVTATLESVNLWDTSSGRRRGSIPTGAGGAGARLTADGRHLFVERRGDIETAFELWSLASGEMPTRLTVAGAVGLVAVNADGSRVAVADFDRAVRVWDFARGRLLTQLDLPLQPAALRLNASGGVLGVVYGNAGLAAFRLEPQPQPLLEEYGSGRWQIAFAPSGSRMAAGRPGAGFQVYELDSGRVLGPALGYAHTGELQGRDSVLLFGQDERSLVTSGMRGGMRFWQVPERAAPAAPVTGHSPWSPAGDAVVAALPRANAMAIADRSGHVHFSGLTDDARTALQEGDDISFVGHSRAVRMLAVATDGRLLASVGSDNTVRVWSTRDGTPMRYIASVPGNPIEAVDFSPDGTVLGLLAGNRLVVMATRDGETLGEIDLLDRHASMVFAGDGTLYAGSEGGTLSAVARDSGGRWDRRVVWQGETAIRKLAASAQGRYLVTVDASDEARLFDLTRGLPGAMTLRMPARVEDLVFSPDGSHVLLRTARWVHQASASANGLAWLDGLLIPRPLSGARIVFGAAALPDGGEFYLPVARDDAAQLLSFAFVSTTGPTLFGNKDELASYWQSRLARSPGAVAGSD